MIFHFIKKRAISFIHKQLEESVFDCVGCASYFLFLLAPCLSAMVTCFEQKIRDASLSNSRFFKLFVYTLLLFFALSPFLLEAKSDSKKSKKQKICLNMIVKDESGVIRRCLDSVKPVIDYWVIVDTGSTDETPEIIKKYLEGIPGELHRRSWRNFGENRSEAFELARGKGDYVLFMDADDLLVFEGEKKFPYLTKDLYMLWRGTKDFSYLKPQIVKGHLPWRWVGVTHEYLDCHRSYTSDILMGVTYLSGEGGARSRDPQKFWKNVYLLEEGLKKEPNNMRYVFYLAESYRDAGAAAEALECYRKRVAGGGWEEEVFWSKLQIAHLLKWFELPLSTVIESYQDAHNYRPHRIEPIYYLAELYNQEGDYQKAYALLKAREGFVQPVKKDLLFHERWIDRYGLFFQLSISSYYVGNYQESLDLCNKLLAMEDLPMEWRKLTEINRIFPLERLQAQKSECLGI